MRLEPVFYARLALPSAAVVIKKADDRRSEPFFLTFRIMRRSYATFSRAWAITTPRMTPTAHYPVAGNLQGAATPMR